MTAAALFVLAAETSKTAFYVLGGGLAVWAVVLALIGLSRPDFPTGAGTARGIYGISTLLVIAAAAAAALTG